MSTESNAAPETFTTIIIPHLLTWIFRVGISQDLSLLIKFHGQLQLTIMVNEHLRAMSPFLCPGWSS
jgi:hypothetical protein